MTGEQTRTYVGSTAPPGDETEEKVGMTGAGARGKGVVLVGAGRGVQRDPQGLD